MDRFVYRDIFEEKLISHTDNIMPLLWILQQDNNPKIKKNFEN